MTRWAVRVGAGMPEGVRMQGCRLATWAGGEASQGRGTQRAQGGGILRVYVVARVVAFFRYAA